MPRAEGSLCPLLEAQRCTGRVSVLRSRNQDSIYSPGECRAAGAWRQVGQGQEATEVRLEPLRWEAEAMDGPRRKETSDQVGQVSSAGDGHTHVLWVNQRYR